MFKMMTDPIVIIEKGISAVSLSKDINAIEPNNITMELPTTIVIIIFFCTSAVANRIADMLKLEFS